MTKILTEHQISVCEKLLFQKLNSEAAKETLQELIVSHRSLNTRNLKLVLENDELMAENEKLKRILEGFNHE